MARTKPVTKFCEALGCARTARSAVAPWCEMHYYRHRRTGTTEERPSPGQDRFMHSGGYVILRAPGHPLARRLGRNHEYEHRVVFYDNHGEGPFLCHWCGVTVTWDDMHVDHLNDVRNDNDPANLASSCPTCNQRRGLPKVTATARRTQGRPIEWRGESRTAGEWADLIGISRSAMQWRLQSSGWSLDRAMTEGRGVTGPRTKKHRPWREIGVVETDAVVAE